LSALTPELAVSQEEIFSHPSTTTTTIMESSASEPQVGGVTELTIAITPFQFSRTADTIQAIVSKFDRLHPVQKQDKRLGYPSQRAYQSEHCYINN